MSYEMTTEEVSKATPTDKSPFWTRTFLVVLAESKLHPAEAVKRAISLADAAEDQCVSPTVLVERAEKERLFAEERRFFEKAGDKLARQIAGTDKDPILVRLAADVDLRVVPSTKLEPLEPSNYWQTCPCCGESHVQ